MDNFLDKYKISKDTIDLDIENMELCNQIYLAIKKKGWSQKSFADKMKVDEGQVSRWLGGAHFMGADTLFKIQKVLGVEIINKRILRQIKELEMLEVQYKNKLSSRHIRVIARKHHRKSNFEYLRSNRNRRISFSI